MNNEYSIEVNNIKKSFKIFYDKGHTLKETSLFKKRRSFEMRQVLRGISFKVKKGEAVALIGHNGCGKSTTLKMLTRILYPDEGNIVMRGRVSSLIELGAGFHPDMTGRENIFNNAAIFGLTHAEIEQRVEQIIEFSELEEFIDNPVRTYSSGMYMRLAFAVAINVDADILLIDEILAVGDAAFQAKCFNKMREIKGEGTTIVLVSHNTGQIEQICDRCIWINEGLIKEEGDPRDVDPRYLEYLVEKSEAHNGAKKQTEKEEKKEQKKEQKDQNRYGNGNAVITSARMLKDEEETDIFDVEDKCAIEVNYEVKHEVPDAVFGIQIHRNDGLACYGTNTRIERFKEFNLKKSGSFRFSISRIALLAGEYWVDIAIESGEGFPVDYWKKAIKFEVRSTINDVNVVRIAHSWTSEVLD